MGLASKIASAGGAAPAAGGFGQGTFQLLQRTDCSSSEQRLVKSNHLADPLIRRRSVRARFWASWAAPDHIRHNP